MERFDQENADHEVRVLSTGEPADVQEVFAPVGQPFEAPAKTIEAGPYYKAVEEIMPELDMSATDDAATADAAAPASSSKLAVDRRDFMRLFSASAIAASTACVKRPVEKAIPYLTQPADLTPGIPTHFATTCGECSAACGVVVKTREGRPVKIEGNDSHPISQGGSCALGQATLQGLYHPDRARRPVVMRGNRNDQADWEEVYEILAKRLEGKKNIGILTCGATGNRHKFFKRVLRQLGAPESNLYTYDSNSLISATAAAHKAVFGLETLPRTDLRQASNIVGIGSDFLEIGLSPVFNAKTFADSQSFNGQTGRMGKFTQFESTLTQTGARAHFRHVIPPGSELLTTLMLIKALAANPKSRGSAGERGQINNVLKQNEALINGGYERLGIPAEVFAGVAEELLSDKAVIMCGGSQGFDENATMLQIAAIMANLLVGAYGTTLYIDKGWMDSPVVAGDMRRFMNEASKLEVLFIVDTNPAFTMPASWNFAGAVKNVPMIISIQAMPNETDRLAHFVLPGHHYTESWGDEQPVAGFWSLRQPAVRPVTDSRQAEDIMLFTLAAMNKPLPYKEYYDFIRDQWKPVHSVMAANVEFNTFFKAVQRRGFVGKLSARSVPGAGDIARSFKISGDQSPGLRLLAPLDIRLRDGRGADKPVLQEVGDSMTTIAWDTWVALNPNTAKKLGFKRNDLLLVEGPGGSFKAALYPLPGLHADAVVVPRGNGRHVGISRVTDGVGVDPLVAFGKAEDPITGDCVTSGQTVKLSRTGDIYMLAAMQKHNDIANRTDIVKKVSLKDAAANLGKLKDLDKVPDLYPKMKQGEFRWGMSVDLTSCTGCSACMVACSVENNVPQVGRELVLMGREMHWIRLDRYFYGDVDKPEVTYQPTMCQHCMNAPCEAVCPVYATTHDPDGMNVQTYNRCVGTRYCANACPYKVRRFNWFTYKWNVIGEKERDRNPRALNPDVTVRTRGIMEKCTFCVQRIKETTHTAKVNGLPINDGEIRTACQQACPSNAITFGNLLDGRSRVANLRRANRAYLSLGGEPDHGHYGLKTLPNVSYLAKVTHQEQVDPHATGGHGDGDHHGEPKPGDGGEHHG